VLSQAGDLLRQEFRVSFFFLYVILFTCSYRGREGVFCCANPLLGRLNSLLVNRFCMPRLCEFVVNVDLKIALIILGVFLFDA
jgi:hypothetical protein